jgi:hypothetical protein
MRQARGRSVTRSRRVAAAIAAAAVVAGLTGAAAPATLASAAADGGGWKQGNGDHALDQSSVNDDPKCGSKGYDHDHEGTCGDEPKAEPQPSQESAYDPNPAPPYVPGYLLPVKVAPAQAASIYTGFIDCGEVVTEPVGAKTSGAQVRRLSDATGDGCSPAEYALDGTKEGVRFLKTGSPYAQFVMNVTWRSELEPPQTATTYVDFELVPGGYELAAPQCPSSVYTGDKLTGLANLDSMSADSLRKYGITDMDGLPSAPKITADNGLTQFACVSGLPNNKFVGGDDPHYEITQEMYILGDIYIRH